jgi:polyhydroxybutyrate depolymerase
VPLVVSLHAAALWPAAQQGITRWNDLADREGFIVVYPAGTGAGPRVWATRPGPKLDADVRFIADLIDTLSARYRIDRARVYVDGLSNGGGMAFALSCTLPDRIAAVGIVAGAQTFTPAWCPDRRPLPMIAFHGTADPLVPLAGRGRSLLVPDPIVGQAARAAGWVRRNRCAPVPTMTRIAPHVTRAAYACPAGADVVFYTVAGGGHAWPGGRPLPAWLAGPTTREVSATRVMWDFFRAHPLSAARR